RPGPPPGGARGPGGGAGAQPAGGGAPPAPPGGGPPPPRGRPTTPDARTAQQPTRPSPIRRGSVRRWRFAMLKRRGGSIVEEWARSGDRVRSGRSGSVRRDVPTAAPRHPRQHRWRARARPRSGPRHGPPRRKPTRSSRLTSASPATVSPAPQPGGRCPRGSRPHRDRRIERGGRMSSSRSIAPQTLRPPAVVRLASRRPAGRRRTSDSPQSSDGPRPSGRCPAAAPVCCPPAAGRARAVMAGRGGRPVTPGALSTGRGRGGVR
ncbi:hypothetical protein P3T41_004367, partial [Kitasatospora sp. GAS204B]|nr:hypothetical protein [Kitasatospora sp. GAS204B]